MSLFLDGAESAGKILTALINKESPVLVTGYLPLQKHLFADYYIKKRKQKLIIISNVSDGEMWEKSLTDFGYDVVFPKAEEIKFFLVDAGDRSVKSETVLNLFKLYEKRYDAVILEPKTLLMPYLSPEILLKCKISLKKDATFKMEELVAKLIKGGYTREYKVEGKGQFAVRGGIFDIFSPSSDLPLRIEFFDDKIESLRLFDTFSQKSVKNIDEMDILPALPLIYPEDKKYLKKIEKYINDDTLSDDVKEELNFISSGTYFNGMEKYINLLYPDKVSSILDYIDSGTVFISEIDKFSDELESKIVSFKDDFKDALARGNAIKSKNNIFHDKDKIFYNLQEFDTVMFMFFPKTLRTFKYKTYIREDSRENDVYNGRIPDFISELEYLYDENYRIILASQNPLIFSDICDIATSKNLPVFKNKNRYNFKKCGIYIETCNIDGGYLSSSDKIAVFGESSIFRKMKVETRKKTKTYNTKKIENFIELKKGDIVVHEVYGIGRFTDIEQKEFDGAKKDYIRLVYAEGDAVYLPLEQMDKIQKYIGSTDGATLSNLGGGAWKKTKSGAKKIIAEVAKDIVELYAKRRKEKGYAYRKDTPWQAEFENDFPFEETPDQKKAIEEIKADMESEKVMDRLLCGDVGYGKTEVALRAMFKACMDSKQCAFLAPTTILVQQHYLTMKERFKNYPLKIAMLSRFQTTAEADEIFKKLKKGLIDIVVGTHRILSKRMAFHDLGLVVVDEEQRFGVKQKEKLKQLCVNVDVLTLSATPIPRTLHISLSGIRDMSILNTPPKDRLPIRTYVAENRDEIIEDAVKRELKRGGQVFFLYNRIETISKMYLKLQEILPETSIAIGHGRMSSRQLEKVMSDFYEKKSDILLCTTIIETGMDIRNANTMIVYDADKMGLSQLYQLRGRVGRSDRQGYAYFLYEKDKVLSEISEKRLKAIKEFTEFGSGFKVAMRDLEIRGAGNLLGERQSGHMADVGYGLYLKMLETEIKRLKGEKIEEKIETEIKLNVNAYIPYSYISNEVDKIEVYKKIASVENKEDYEDVKEELCDRFGEMPIEVEALIDISYIKSIGSDLKISKIYKNQKNTIFTDNNNKIILQRNFNEINTYDLIKKLVSFMEKCYNKDAI